MNNLKKEILNTICYTKLVYSRINKKLNTELSNDEIEKMIYNIIKETDELQFHKAGKNVYVKNQERNIEITINMNTFRVITVDNLTK